MIFLLPLLSVTFGPPSGAAPPYVECPTEGVAQNDLPCPGAPGDVPLPGKPGTRTLPMPGKEEERKRRHKNRNTG